MLRFWFCLFLVRNLVSLDCAICACTRWSETESKILLAKKVPAPLIFSHQHFKIYWLKFLSIYIYRNVNIINLWTSGGMFKIQEIDVDTCGSSLIWIWTMRVKNWCPNNLGGEFHWWFKHNGISNHPLTHLFSVRISMNKQTNLRSS